MFQKNSTSTKRAFIARIWLLCMLLRLPGVLGFTQTRFVAWRGRSIFSLSSSSSSSCSSARGFRSFSAMSEANESEEATPSSVPQQQQLPIVVILAGPTAVGKSDVAARLCAAHNGLIVSADSVQAYRAGAIGSNKPTAAERETTPHLLIDVADADMTYNAAEWRHDALYCIQNLTRQADHNSRDEGNDDAATRERQKQLDAEIIKARTLKEKSPDEAILPIVVGGTMMYVQWLVHGRPDALRPTETAVQTAAGTMQTFQDAGDWAGAVKHVADLGPKYGQQIEKLSGRDWYRLRRILEVALTVQEKGGKDDDESSSSLLEGLYSGQRQDKLSSLGFDVRCFFLCPTDRMVHSKVVDQRCEQMVQRGLLEETTDLACAGQLPDMATKAIGYRQTLDYLGAVDVKDGDEAALVNFLEEFSTSTRRYSKRQMQWFRRDKDFVFVPISLENKAKDARVESAAKEIGRLLALSRSDFDRERTNPNGLNENTRQANEAQGKKMRTYQFARYELTDGSKAFRNILERADACRHRFQAKRTKHETTTTTST